MARTLLSAVVLATGLIGATAAHADTHWSIGINVPVPGVVVSNDGYYVQDPRPVYYAPAPVVRYAPVPRYAPAPIYFEPSGYSPPVVYEQLQPVDLVPRRERRSDQDFHWERSAEFEHAPWEHERHQRHEHWEHDDEGDSHREHRD